MDQTTSRRDLLKGSAAAAVGLAFSGSALAQGTGTRTQSVGTRAQRPRFAVIGVTGRGGDNLRSAAAHGDIVALCDIDVDRLTKTLIEHPGAASFADFRKMLDVMHNQIDAVVVSTPDHTHAPAAALAMHHGKHVYCEKPLTRTIGEARRLTELARQKKIMSQMGNQGTANSNLRKVAALLKRGDFGAVKEIHCWTNRSGGWWPQGVDRPAPTPTPRTVNWDLWVGPSPFRPHAPGYHAFAWRGWWDFGSGALGDIGCHNMNLPFMAFDLRDPVAMTAKTSGHNRDSFPLWSIITYEFPKRGNRPAVNLTWYDGGKLPSQDLIPGLTMESNGCIIVCEKATLYSPSEYAQTTVLVGGGKLPDIEFEESPGHFTEFAQSIFSGKQPKGNIANYAGALTETVLLGNLAVWADGERILWDAKNLRVQGHPEYDALIRPKYRDGWSL